VTHRNAAVELADADGLGGYVVVADRLRAEIHRAQSLTDESDPMIQSTQNRSINVMNLKK